MTRDPRVQHDWGSHGIDWRDESMDDEMAQDWLRAIHDPLSDDSSDVMGRVMELVQTGLDPPRGWRLTKRLIELADDDNELRAIGRTILTQLLFWHADLVGAELAELVKTDGRYKEAFYGQFPSQARSNFERRFGLAPE